VQSALPFGVGVGRRRPWILGSRPRPLEIAEVRRAFGEPIGAAETIARHIADLATQLCAMLART
jgi:protein ImuB